MKKQKHYHYFVSYVTILPFTVGTIEILTDKKVSCYDDISNFRNVIVENSTYDLTADRVLVLNLHLIRNRRY